MAFEVSEFLALRSHAFHVTARENLPRLRRIRRLDATATLLAEAGRPDLLRRRRTGSEFLVIGSEVVALKDQLPLIESNADIPVPWTFQDLVEHLNQHVFFWPGSATAPIRAGRRLLDHYREDGPAVIRVPSRDLLARNGSIVPLFCPFNSGAPRQQAGQRVRRGPDLFQAAAAFPRRASEVTELVFQSSAQLPDSCEVYSPSGWSAL